LVTVFMIQAHRSQEAAKALLGAFAGILISDRYSAYNPWDLGRRQVCWAHLRRDFKAMSERSGVGGVIGKGLFEASHQLFEKWHRYREGLLEAVVFREEMASIKANVEALLAKGAACSDKKASPGNAPGFSPWPRPCGPSFASPTWSQPTMRRSGRYDQRCSGAKAASGPTARLAAASRNAS
ncbi:MAG: transposase, partial [Magnetococcales bacterium]|nr:transposase [Magnetococcales bacterium]